MKIINVVSGKGGTGKSLLTAVLGRALAREGLRILLVDLDVFVRGLTVLLTESGQQALRTQASTVTELLAADPHELNREQLTFARFYECDVLPAVTSVGAPYEFGDKRESLSDTTMILRAVAGLLRSLDYDVIFLDNRAGLDNIIVASSDVSDVVLSVAEDDIVSLQTNANLINHLRYIQKIRAVYTVINKARRIRTYDDLKGATSFRQTEFNYVGVIPFDAEVMDDFGTVRFWTTVYESLYFRALIDAWNKLASLEQIKEISLERYRFPLGIFMTRSSGRHSLIERMALFYGLIISLSGIGLWVYPRMKAGTIGTTDAYAIAAILFGLVFLFFGFTGFRQYLIGPKFPSDDARSTQSTRR